MQIAVFKSAFGLTMEKVRLQKNLKNKIKFSPMEIEMPEEEAKNKWIKDCLVQQEYLNVSPISI